MSEGGQLVHLHVMIWYSQRLYQQTFHSVNKLSNSRSFLRRRKRINKTKADPGHFDREIENNFRPSYSALPCFRASDGGIRWCEVRFLMGTPNVFFVPRSWQDEKHLSFSISLPGSKLTVSHILFTNNDNVLKGNQHHRHIVKCFYIFHDVV